MTDDSPKKKCFVIGPIGEAGSEKRNKADYLLELIIKPTVEKYGYKAFRADEVSDPGLISEQVISYTLDSDLVIADLTSHNPNAFYELGIRHTGSKKPTIHMILEGETPPFDVKDHRYIPYKLDNPKDLDDAVVNLSKAISSLGSNPEVHNPVTKARGLDQISSGEDTKDQILAGLVEKTNRLERELIYLRASKDKIDVSKILYVPRKDLSENPHSIGKNIAKRYTEKIKQDADKENFYVFLKNQDKEEDE
ncbi:MAG: hypothetical protein KME67_10875 [Candidatus Thiodiazotropha sp. (ex Codakia orbicularis)]|nr:hypothetical protein [Candidatus Thiodiazotropha sp. (ex Codakia orbicularis)]